jgi:hypothetical protein
MVFSQSTGARERINGRVCWVITSVMTFREVYQAHRMALEGKAIGLDDHEVTRELLDSAEGES